MTPDQPDQTFRDSYARDGCAFPCQVFSREKTASFRRQLEQLEAQLGDRQLGNKGQINYPHLVFSFASEIVHNPLLLDYVEQLLGPDIMVWNATLFIKEPHSNSHVGWHQDLKYWGLQQQQGQVSAWLALSEVDRENGCMQFLPGSHLGEMAEHQDTFSCDSALTRGQQVAISSDEGKCHVPLTAGQVSFHHGKLLHCSAPNRSSRRRIGLTINYISTSNRQQLLERDYAMLVRGEDKYRHFEHLTAPQGDLTEHALAQHRQVLAAQNKAIYA